MLQNAYFLEKIGADTAENEQHFAVASLLLEAPRREEEDLRPRGVVSRWDRAEDRRVFVTRALEKGVVSKAVECCERGSVGLAVAALNFLADFTFQSDAGAEAVLDQFPRINARCP